MLGALFLDVLVRQVYYIMYLVFPHPNCHPFVLCWPFLFWFYCTCISHYCLYWDWTGTCDMDLLRQTIDLREYCRLKSEFPGSLLIPRMEALKLADINTKWLAYLKILKRSHSITGLRWNYYTSKRQEAMLRRRAIAHNCRVEKYACLSSPCNMHIKRTRSSLLL